MYVEIDRDRCEGNAVCVGIAPEIFDIIDDDYVVVRTAPVPTNKEALAER